MDSLSYLMAGLTPEQFAILLCACLTIAVVFGMAGGVGVGIALMILEKALRWLKRFTNS